MKHTLPVSRIILTIAASAFLSASVAGQDTARTIFQANDEWRAIDYQPALIAKGTALDFSSDLDAPAGKHGAAVVREGQFVFADAPDKPVQLYGVVVSHTLPFQDKAGCERTADYLAATAHLVHARGGAGVSLFNFVYYRNLADQKTEPPFDVLAHLKDRDWLARQPQHYFLSNATNPPSEPSPFARNRIVSAGKERLFVIDAAPPSGGWKTGGRLRIQSRSPVEQRQLVVRFNDRELTPTDDILEPYPQPYTDGLGSAETLRAWTVPKQALRDGPNEIKLRFSDGSPLEIVFVDLSIQ
jgi:hypothetical protein